MINKTVGGYYGSELNKFVDENCNHEMTAMNIDLIMHKEYKKSIRIIESKRSTEGMKTGQRKLLKLLAGCQDAISAATGYTFEVFIIYGDPPYHTANIMRLKDDKVATVDKNILIKFLEFEIPFEQIVPMELPL